MLYLLSRGPVYASYQKGAANMQKIKPLRALREDRFMTRLELAVRLGVSVNSVYNWEMGIRCPLASHLRKLANEYNLSPGEIRDSFYMLAAQNVTEEGIQDDRSTEDPQPAQAESASYSN